MQLFVTKRIFFYGNCISCTFSVLISPMHARYSMSLGLTFFQSLWYTVRYHSHTILASPLACFGSHSILTCTKFVWGLSFLLDGIQSDRSKRILSDGKTGLWTKTADMIIKLWNSARNMAEAWSLCSPIDSIIDDMSPLIQCAPLAVSCIWQGGKKPCDHDILSIVLIEPFLLGGGAYWKGFLKGFFPSGQSSVNGPFWEETAHLSLCHFNELYDGPVSHERNHGKWKREIL